MEEHRFQETRDAARLTYCFPDERELSVTGFHVLRACGGGLFLLPARTALNGQTRLVYDLGVSRPLTAFRPERALYLRACAQLLEACLLVRENGFLSGNCVRTEEQDIFADPEGQEVRLLYLPLAAEGGDTILLDELERRVRERMRALLEKLPEADRPGDFCAALSDLSASAEYFRALLPDPGGETPSLCLVRRGGSQPIIIRPAGGSVIIGRKAEFVIADVSVSGQHCRLFSEGGGLRIEDLGSRNGTFVGGRRLSPHLPAALSEGDLVRIARFTFQVERHREATWQNAR